MKTVSNYLNYYDLYKEAKNKHEAEIKSFARSQPDKNYIKLVETALNMGISNFNYFTYDPIELSQLVEEYEQIARAERREAKEAYIQSIRV